MPNSSNKDIQSTAQSLAPLVITCSSLWEPTEQPKYSPSKSIGTRTESFPHHFHHVKQSESRFQEQDSSSTLSTCQSHYAMVSMGTNNSTVQNLAPGQGSDETYGRNADCFQRSSLPFADYASRQVQMDYNQSMACIPYSWAESYFGGLVAACGPNALIYPQMVGITQGRVPLPLECAESIPIYVNAKQFRAILKRRQKRAKLEADIKIAKSRKPYLHESRHNHALRRARGSGGRFLSSNNSKKSKTSSPSYCKDILHHKFGGDLRGSEGQHSETGSWGSSTPAGSDVTTIFSGDDIFQRPQIRVSRSPFHLHVQVGEDPTHAEAGNRLLLSIDRCARK